MIRNRPETGFGEIKERPTRPMIIESVCVAFMPFRSLGQRATITGIRNGAGFPNLRSKIQAKLGLILRELGPLHCRDGNAFAVIVHQKRSKQI